MDGCRNPFGVMFSSVRDITPGVITLWSGLITGIPPGWFLCDGTNGTPDLTDKFVMSAGPSFGVNATAEAKGHEHTFVGDGHNHNLTSVGAVPLALDPGSLTDTVAVTGTTDNTKVVPEFYALAYIMLPAD